MPDSMTQTPHRLALPEGHGGVARILPEQVNLDCALTDCSGPTSLPSSTVPRVECTAETQFRYLDPNTNMANSDSYHPPLQVAHNVQPRSPGLGDSVPNSTVNGLSGQSPWWPLPAFPTSSLNLLFSPQNPHAPSKTQSILSFPVTRSFIIASIVCLLAFLIYIFPPLSRDMPSFR